MEGLPVSVWLWIAALIAQTVAFTAVGTWWVSKLIAAIREEIKNERREVDQSLADAENDWRDRIEKSERMYGETVAAIRQYVHNFELFVRDNYVRRDSFSQTSDEWKETIREFSDRIEKRIEIMDKKIDRLQQRPGVP